MFVEYVTVTLWKWQFDLFYSKILLYFSQNYVFHTFFSLSLKSTNTLQLTHLFADRQSSVIPNYYLQVVKLISKALLLLIMKTCKNIHNYTVISIPDCEDEWKKQHLKIIIKSKHLLLYVTYVTTCVVDGNVPWMKFYRLYIRYLLLDSNFRCNVYVEHLKTFNTL